MSVKSTDVDTFALVWPLRAAPRRRSSSTTFDEYQT